MELLFEEQLLDIMRDRKMMQFQCATLRRADKEIEKYEKSKQTYVEPFSCINMCGAYNRIAYYYAFRTNLYFLHRKILCR